MANGGEYNKRHNTVNYAVYEAISAVAAAAVFLGDKRRNTETSASAENASPSAKAKDRSRTEQELSAPAVQSSWSRVNPCVVLRKAHVALPLGRG
jgi:hypothetical protein